MMLEAVWFRNGKEIHSVSPVMNIVCYENMENIAEIEVEDGDDWWFITEADDFVIRVKKVEE